MKCIQRVNYAFSNLSKVLYSLYLSIFATFRKKKYWKQCPSRFMTNVCAVLISTSFFLALILYFLSQNFLCFFLKLILTIKGIVLSFVLFNYMSRSKYGWFILFAVQFAPIPIYYSIKKQLINRNFGNFPNVSFKVILLLLIW